MLTITPQSTPPLQSGRYFIALGVYTTGVDINGTLTATITTGGGQQPTEAGGETLMKTNATAGRREVSRKRYTRLVKGLKP